MKINGKATRTIWPENGGAFVAIIDQTLLPHRLETVSLETVEDAARAILTMQVRGAPLIGATAAYGLALALRQGAAGKRDDNGVVAGQENVDPADLDNPRDQRPVQ